MIIAARERRMEFGSNLGGAHVLIRGETQPTHGLGVVAINADAARVAVSASGGQACKTK